jgi:hypothetical protein
MEPIRESLSFWEHASSVLTLIALSARTIITVKGVMVISLSSLPMELALYRPQGMIVQEREMEIVLQALIVEVAWLLAWALEEGFWQSARWR